MTDRGNVFSASRKNSRCIGTSAIIQVNQVGLYVTNLLSNLLENGTLETQKVPDVFQRLVESLDSPPQNRSNFRLQTEFAKFFRRTSFRLMWI